VNTQLETRKPWTDGVLFVLKTRAVALVLLARLMPIPELQAPEDSGVAADANLRRAPDAVNIEPQCRNAALTRSVLNVNRLVM
jgi:hypothetical protein